MHPKKVHLSVRNDLISVVHSYGHGVPRMQPVQCSNEACAVMLLAGTLPLKLALRVGALRDKPVVARSAAHLPYTDNMLGGKAWVLGGQGIELKTNLAVDVVEASL